MQEFEQEVRNVYISRELVKSIRHSYYNVRQLSIAMYIALHSIATSTSQQVMPRLRFEDVNEFLGLSNYTRTKFKDDINWLEMGQHIKAQKIDEKGDYINVLSARVYYCLALYHDEVEAIVAKAKGDNLIDMLHVYLDVQVRLPYWKEQFLTWDSTQKMAVDCALSHKKYRDVLAKLIDIKALGQVPHEFNGETYCNYCSYCELDQATKQQDAKDKRKAKKSEKVA